MAASGALLDGDSSKYAKRRSETSSRRFYIGLTVVMGLAMLYLLAPARPSDAAAAAVASLRSSTAGADSVSRSSSSSDPVAASSENDDASNGDDDDAPTYPRYEGAPSDSDDLVSPEDEPAPADSDDAGESDPELSPSKADEETAGDAYDEKQEGALFEDQEAFNAAPVIKVLPESRKRKYSKIVLAHERYHRAHASKLYVPRLRADAKLTVEQFRKLFMEPSQPVIIPFDAMRHLNFTSNGFTLDEMQRIYPNTRPSLYKYGAIISDQIDLGPALAALRDDKTLRKTTTGKSYPRNTKIRLESLAPLDQQRPPLIPDIPMMLPSLWFGPTSAATPLHADCCDNWAVMIAGTKRWTVAPPAEARLLKPNCQGGLCWVKALVHADEHAATPAEKRLRDSVQFVSFDLSAGEMLYLPAGWFHHVENVGGTVMVNHWSKAGPEFLTHYDALVRAKKV